MSLLDAIEGLVAPETYIVDNVAQQACIDNVDGQVQPLDDAASEVAAWNPGSFYFTPDDLDQVTKQMIVVGTKAFDALAQAAQVINQSDYHDAQNIFDRILKRISAVASANEDYVVAVNAARTGNFQAVYAPDLRNWAVETLQATSEAVRYSYLVACEVPAIVTALIDLSQASIAFANLVKSLVGLVASAVGAAYNAVKHAFGFLQWFALYWPWLAAGGIALGAGFYVWRWRRHRHQLGYLALPQGEE